MKFDRVATASRTDTANKNERDPQRPRSFLSRFVIAYAPRTTVNTISSANSTSDSISARPRIIIV